MCAYAKLLKQNDGFTASEIAKLSGVEEEKARQVLDALQQLGVVVKRGRKYYHIADSHHEGVDRLLSTLSFYFPNPEELTREFDEAYSRVSRKCSTGLSESTLRKTTTSSPEVKRGS